MTVPTPSHQALYRRWRAQTFGEMVGQEAVVETLRNAVRTEQVAHGMLFVGPRGTGKTSTARIMAKALNCTNLRDGEPCDVCEACVAIREGRALDVIEMDAASHNKVEDIREFLPRVYTTPSDLRRKVFIIDEVQRITQGWDLLLKTLEEPPDHVAFIFCTTDASQVRPAVLSRVQRFDFRPLTVEQIEGKLRRVLEAEGRAAEPEAITLVARLAAGGMRDAESMLDQLLTSGSGTLTAEQVRELLGVVDGETVQAFIDALVTGDALTGIQLLDRLEDRGRDVRSFLNQVVDGLRANLVARLTQGRTAQPGVSASELAAAARRLASIDPSRGGPGGLRFQLELVLLAPLAGGSPEFAAESRDRAVVDTNPAPQRTTDGKVAQNGGVAVGPGVTPDAGGAPTPAARSAAAPASATAVPAARSAAAPTPEAAPAARSTATPEVPRAVRPAPARSDRSSAASDAASSPAVGSAAIGPGAAGPASGPGPAAPGDAMADLQRLWPEIVAWISKSPAVKPLITVCRPISVDGNVVTLGFPEGQGFLRAVAERRRPMLEDGVAHFLGHPVAVRCVATNLELAPPATADEEAVRLLDEARRIFADDLVDIGEVT